MNEDKKIDIREAWQQEATNTWVKFGGKGTVEAGTGTGKTYLGFKVIQTYIKKLGNKSIHVVVPTRLLKTQWEDTLPDDIKSLVEVFVINTYVKEHRKCDLLILDEMHNYAAPKFIKVLHMGYKNILGLTATLKRKDDEHVRLVKYAPLIYKLPIETARKLGFVSDYQVYNLGVDFTDTNDRAGYRKAHKSFLGLFKLFDHNFPNLMACVKGDIRTINHVAENIEVPIADVRKYAYMCLRSMKSRQEILYESYSKLPIVAELVKRSAGQSIVFTQTIESCETITGSIPGAVAYHSGLKGRLLPKGKKLSASKVKKQIIEDFESTKYSTLVGAKALNEGFSVNAVDLAVMFSYTSDIRTFVQRMGRAVRFVEGKKARIVALYMKPFEFAGEKINSQEIKWLKEAQKSNIGTVEWVESIDEIFADEPTFTF